MRAVRTAAHASPCSRAISASSAGCRAMGSARAAMEATSLPAAVSLVSSALRLSHAQGISEQGRDGMQRCPPPLKADTGGPAAAPSVLSMAPSLHARLQHPAPVDCTVERQNQRQGVHAAVSACSVSCRAMTPPARHPHRAQLPAWSSPPCACKTCDALPHELIDAESPSPSI